MKKNRITELFQIDYPLIQAGMVWVSGAKLAAASANSGVLGIIGAGSMKPILLKEHIEKALTLTNKPLAVNLPLIYKGIEEQIDICLELGIKIFFTSAGSPKKFTEKLKSKGSTVVHVTSTPELAKKCEDAGVDAVVVEGFEAGGHNGRDELTSMVLIPKCVDTVKIPVIAAGGFSDGRSIAAAFSLGAEGVQMGTRFLMTKESSAHQNFKDLLLTATSNSTELTMKEHIPVRLFKNKFYDQVKDLHNKDELVKVLGKGRAKMGMLEGDLDEGELEVGQICYGIKDLPTVQELVERLISEYDQTIESLKL